MAMSRKEIQSFIKSKQRKPEEYQAPTVRVNDNGVPTQRNTTQTVTNINNNTSNMVSKPETQTTVNMPSINNLNLSKKDIQKIANKNYEDKLAIFNKASQDYENRRTDEFLRRNVNQTQAFKDYGKDKLTRDNQRTALEDQQRYYKALPSVEKAIQNETDARSKAQNDLRLAAYQKNVADVDAHDVNLFDQTVGQLLGGVGDYFSTITDENKYVDENGNTIYLPSKNDLMQQKIQDSYGKGFFGDLARFGGNVAHELSKQAATRGLNMATGYGGTALYFSDIIADQYKQNINEGYDEQKALGDALLKGGANYIKQKIIGGLGGKLTGSANPSWLEDTLTKSWTKALGNETIANILSSMSAEAIDEFTDTYVEAGIDAAILGKHVNADELLLDALYSGAVGGVTGATGGIGGTPSVNQNINTNIDENVQPTTQTETPQIQTNEVEQTNTQPRLEQAQIDLNEANNEPTINNEQIEQDLIREINKEQQKLDNGKSEDDGYHLAELQKELQDRRKNSIANDSNTFNLNKIDERNTLESIRSKEDISDKKVNAYQYDNPEVRPYFQEMAGELSDALNNFTQNGERFMREDGSWGGQKFSSTPEITELHNDYKMSLKDIEKGIDGILEDTGKENNAASKKVELVIDKMLRNGYQNAFTGEKIGTDQNYLNTLSGQPTVNQNVDTDEELPFLTNEDTDRERLERENELKENNNLAEAKSEDVIKQELTPQQEEQHFVDEGVDPKVAKVLSEMPKPEKTPLRERIKQGKATLREEWSYFKRNFVDKGETIYRLAKQLKKPRLYAKYDKMGTTRGEANYSIGKGQQNLQGKLYNNFTDENGKKVSMSLNKIWDGVDQQAANEYLAHWLNVDRYNQETQDGENKYVFGTPEITPEISMQKIAELEKSNPELKRFGENVWQYGKNMLQNMVDGGLVSKEQAQQFQKETPHYVRLQRNVDKGGKTSLDFDDNGHARVNKQIKEFKGSDIDILPFKNSMADYTFDVAQAIRTNLFAQELGNAMSMSSTDNDVTSLDESFGIRPDLLRDNGDGTYSLTAFNNGVATVIPIDKGIYESLTPTKHYDFEDKLPFKGIRKIDSFRKALLTDKNPMFLATNMMKDAFDAPLNSKYPLLFAKNYARAVKEITTNGKYYQQYQALGGLQNSYFEKSEFQKEGSKTNPLTWIEKGNNAIEQFPRLAEFISTMEKTGDIDEAMYNAAEITTNFKRGGDVTKAANRNGVTFLNASVQGFDKQIRNFTDIQSPKQAVQLLGKIVVLGIAPAIINDAMYKDDEEYKEMQDYIKDRYYLFKGKNGDWVRIPKGRAVSVFQSAARRTGYALDGDKDAFKGFVNFASTQVAPNNPFENNIISPLVDVARNESWSGNKIVSDSKSNKEHPDEEFNEKTDEFSKWLGKQLNASPMKINYLIDQYSGGVGDVVLPTITPKTTSKSTNPIEQAFASKFTTDPVYSNKNLSVFYDTKEKYENEKKSVKGTQMDKLKYSYLNSQGMKIAELSKEQSKIQSDTSLSNKEKYEKAREIQKQINELAKKSVKDIENIENNEYYAIVGDNTYRLVDNGDGTQSFSKDAYADSHKKSAEKKGMALYDYYKQQYEKRKEKK